MTIAQVYRGSFQTLLKFKFYGNINITLTVYIFLQFFEERELHIIRHTFRKQKIQKNF